MTTPTQPHAPTMRAIAEAWREFGQGKTIRPFDMVLDGIADALERAAVGVEKVGAGPGGMWCHYSTGCNSPVTCSVEKRCIHIEAPGAQALGGEDGGLSRVSGSPDAKAESAPPPSSTAPAQPNGAIDTEHGERASAFAVRDGARAEPPNPARTSAAAPSRFDRGGGYDLNNEGDQVCDSEGGIKTAQPEAAQEGKLESHLEPYRCYHCGDTFMGVDARNHFGTDQTSDPACKIKLAGEFALLRMLREQEDQLARYRAEDSDVMRSMWAMQDDHRRAVTDAEQKGYDRGLADAKAHPEDLGLCRPSPTPQQTGEHELRLSTWWRTCVEHFEVARAIEGSHALKILKGAGDSMAAALEHAYEYEKLEAALSAPVAWLLINALCRHGVDAIEYGTSPRYGWLTKEGLALKDFIDTHSVDELCAMTVRNEAANVCYPDACNCGPDGYDPKRVCANPFWPKRTP